MEHLTFNDYQLQASQTSPEPVSEIHPEWKKISATVDYLFHASLGIAEESGEILGKLKKIYRDRHEIVTPNDKVEIMKEAGDLLWYLSELATLMGFTLGEVAQMNLDKLKDRAIRGVIHGEGDHR